MGNTFGDHICVRQPVKANRKYLETKKRNKRRTNKFLTPTLNTSDTSSITTECMRKQAADRTEDKENEDTDLPENCFAVKDEAEQTDESDSENVIDIPPLQDGYMKMSDFKRFAEVYFHKKGKKKSLAELQTEFLDSVQEYKMPDVVQGFIEREKEDAFSAGEDEIASSPISQTHKNSCISDCNNSSFNSKPQNLDQENSVESEIIQEDENSSTQRKSNLENWYISVESYADSAKNFTISRLKMRNEKATFMSLPNLSDISCNEHMKEPVFSESTEINYSSLSDDCVSVGYEHEHMMQGLKRNTSACESTTDSGRSSDDTDLSSTRLDRERHGYSRFLCKPDCSACRAVQLEYMVDVYKPLILRQINVTDILEYLPLIDERNKAMLHSKHYQSPHDAMDMLINVIKNSNAPGKWQSFLDSIRQTEFTYISRLLNEETEVQYNYSSTVLSLLSPEIRIRMCLPDFLDKVFENELLTEAEKNEATSLPKGEAEIYILDKIDKHLPNWDRVFIDVLSQSYMSDLAELFVLVSPDETDGSEPKTRKYGKLDNRKFRRAIKNQRLQLQEKAHGRPKARADSKLDLCKNHSYSSNITAELSANIDRNANGIDGLLEKSVMDLLTVAEGLKSHIGNKGSEVTNIYGDSFLQNVLSEQMKLRKQQQVILDHVTDLKRDMTELKSFLITN